MSTLESVLVVLMMIISTVAQKGKRIVARESTVNSSGQLQPWLLGLTAMVVFLFIVFVLMIVNRLWCKKEKKDYFEEGMKQERLAENAYENLGLDEEEGRKTKELNEELNEDKRKLDEQQSEEQKVTAM
ncbi:small integral membrane protein 24 [Pelodytes ibericus]